MIRAGVNTLVAVWIVGVVGNPAASGSGLAEYFHHEGPLSGTLKSAAPLPIYDADPQHLWNRMFAAFYIRPRLVPSEDGRSEVVRYEGGDVIEFLAWGQTNYWSSEEVFRKVNPLLGEFLADAGWQQIRDPLKRALFQHDLWAVYDHLIDQNIRRTGDKRVRARRSLLCKKLAKCMEQLALSTAEIDRLPDTYPLAVQSEAFVPRHGFDPSADYLPSGLLNQPDEWIEVDFYYPDMHEDIMDRFISLHARSLMGRSHYRIFYRFPNGRGEAENYLKELEAEGIDWKYAAQFGFIPPPKTGPQIPVGTEVVLLQLMMSIDNQLRPVPTNLVESLQLRVFLNLDGSSEPATNTGVGINVLDYRMKRHLMFDNFKAGGLHREPEDEPQYRVAIDGNSPKSPDWGFAGKAVLFQQCVDCHMSPRLDRLGVASMPSIIHSGGFGAGAQLGVARPLAPNEVDMRGQRVARFKSRHESFRRLLDYVGR